jgi:exodeoxyribonuclease V alpha subunit
MTARPPIESIAGTVERVTYHDVEKGGFCVLKANVKGRRDIETVIGYAAAARAGESFRARGSWITDRVHGRQFKAETLETEPPAGLDGIEKYLASGLIRGIGKILAKKLTATFGESVFETIENEPERLVSINGIGTLKAKGIRDAWERQKAIQRIMVFLHANGVSTGRAVRIHKTYGEGAIDKITDDPYVLARDIRGIGFKTADAIAAKLSIVGKDPRRLRAGIGHALTSAMDDGHCGLPKKRLLAFAAELLGDADGKIDEKAIDAALGEALREGDVVGVSVGETPTVFLAGLHRQETRIAERLLSLAKRPPPWAKTDAQAALAAAQATAEVSLSPSQRDGLRRLLGARFGILAGGPGVGKTTCTRLFADILETLGLRVVLAAPTGKAAKRMSEATGRKAATIHRLLGAKPGSWQRNADDPLELDVLILDETSMVDVSLMHAVLAALPSEAALFLIGDPDQLPSVGPGRILGDVLDSGRFVAVRLTEIHRQAVGSRIVANAHSINAGRIPDLANRRDGDFFFIEAEDGESAAAIVSDLVAERLPKTYGFDPIRDIQTLTPMRRSASGAYALNETLQARLNPNPHGEKAEVIRYGTQFRVGDKVMQQRNDYDLDVMNGDSGTVSAIDEENETMDVSIDGEDVRYSFDDLDELELAYAYTIHKSQGGEAPCVVIPITTQHFSMLTRNLLYTGLTRGRKLVVLVGQRKAVAMAVRNVSAEPRWTWLREALRDDRASSSAMAKMTSP